MTRCALAAGNGAPEAQHATQHRNTAHGILAWAPMGQGGWAALSGSPGKAGKLLYLLALPLPCCCVQLIFEADVRQVDTPWVVAGVREVMEGAAGLEVPLVVSIKAGERWGSMQAVGAEAQAAPPQQQV